MVVKIINLLQDIRPVHVPVERNGLLLLYYSNVGYVINTFPFILESSCNDFICWQSLVRSQFFRSEKIIPASAWAKAARVKSLKIELRK